MSLSRRQLGRILRGIEDTGRTIDASSGGDLTPGKIKFPADKAAAPTAATLEIYSSRERLAKRRAFLAYARKPIRDRRFILSRECY